MARRIAGNGIDGVLYLLDLFLRAVDKDAILVRVGVDEHLAVNAAAAVDLVEISPSFTTSMLVTLTGSPLKGGVMS